MGRGRRGTSLPAPVRRAALTLSTIEQLLLNFKGLRSIRREKVGRRLSLTRAAAHGQLSSLAQQVENTNPPGEVGTGRNEVENSGSQTEARCSAVHGAALGPYWWCFSLNHESTVSTESVPEDRDLLSLNVAARRLSICRRTLERLIAAGEFPQPVKVRGATRVPVTDLQAYLAKLLAHRGAAL
jgi:excisionase family DNA binding protein